MDVNKLIKGISAVRGLMNNSHGVYGLHMNGDPAHWDDLEIGGQFEWLVDFNEAEKEISRHHKETLKGGA